MHDMPPTFKTKSGEVRVVDSKTFPISKTIAAAKVTIKPGGMRELHWHQNANEWQYYIQGQARMTVFFNAATAQTANFAAGDVGFVPRTFGHYVENTGDTDLIVLELFKSDRYMDLSLSEWVRNAPPELMIQTLGISKETLEAIPVNEAFIVPL
jgi:oxalate decarboxylase